MRQTVIILIVTVFLSGCKKASQEEFIDNQIDMAVHYLSHPEISQTTNICKIANGVVSQISTLTNEAIRAQYLEKYAYRLMDIDLRNERYYYQQQLNDDVEHIIWWRIGSGLSKCDDGLRRSCQIRFKLLEWLDDRIAYIRTKPKVNYRYVKGNPVYDQEEFEWTNVFSRLFHSKRYYLRELEDPDRWKVLFLLDAAQRDHDMIAIRAYIETWLGRSLRSKEELKADGKSETKDYWREKDSCNNAPSVR